MDESSEIDFLTIESADSDLLIRLDEAQREQPSDSTYRDQKAPKPTYGDHFEPLRHSIRPPAILELPLTPMSLFQQFLLISLVKEWVRYTNEGRKPRLIGPDLP
jgi:hypothetical protein